LKESATFRTGFDRTARLEGSMETVLVGSLATLGTGRIRLLLRGATRRGLRFCCIHTRRQCQAILLQDVRRRRGPFLFPAAFETFDDWIEPRDALATGCGCPSLREGSLLDRDVCPAVGRRARVPRSESVQRRHSLIRLNRCLRRLAMI
jgi:hypothetical protein